jgi:hypothetical protein
LEEFAMMLRTSSPMVRGLFAIGFLLRIHAGTNAQVIFLDDFNGPSMSPVWHSQSAEVRRCG